MIQYYLYKKIDACQTPENNTILGNDYENCKLCKGNSFFIADENQKDTLKLNDEDFSYDDATQIFTATDAKSLQQLIVESFQLLWNCNNPTKIIQVNGQLDVETEDALNKTDTNGFQSRCMQCEVENCGKCSLLSTDQCEICKEGYSYKDSKCVGCQIDGCNECPLDKNGEEKCSQCIKGLYLYENQCVSECPQGLTQSKKACLDCRLGTYASDFQCLSCQPNTCKVCSGPQINQCQTCFEGFVRDETNGCRPCVGNECCASDKCEDDQFRQSDYPFQCQYCSDLCATCTGPDQDNCLSCKNGYQLEAGQCINPGKKEQFFLDPQTNILTPCHFSCLECIDASEYCTICKPDMNYFIEVEDRFQCDSKCPIGYEPEAEIQSDIQIKCIIKSEKPTVEIVINDPDLPVDNGNESDIPSIIKEMDEIVGNCAFSQYWDGEQCQQCPLNCIECLSNNECTECQQGYFWTKKHPNVKIAIKHVKHVLVQAIKNVQNVQISQIYFHKMVYVIRTHQVMIQTINLQFLNLKYFLIQTLVEHLLLKVINIKQI
ncbi:zinc finger lsd1 subclass family protein, putative [Ichthyophthirius multifiliis]|uniref:Zinc finger lsd1 subclass family protein, putative n=1 Tax=Ichthyophthirius multifiliis TaxID=5932 RepID=G0QSC1_ICHMU|nr:zinc finger lsd1 subclass family protein, putative [Ichthyophthirius multifiliis]EGR31868.1 zinc finger lsd1 subclass family protein, putative [Ichthyophthirius multifiliis]|eukprot:XP_004035354.1 zinc finger lsd1 subclass family protein, putative [Ichthyophthirius multifiliis]